MGIVAIEPDLLTVLIEVSVEFIELFRFALYFMMDYVMIKKDWKRSYVFEKRYRKKELKYQKMKSN